MSRAFRKSRPSFLLKEEPSIEALLRPTSWNDYIGQEKIKSNLRLIIEAAKKRNETCDHLLLYGQAGLGKTTLANLIAKELGGQLKVATGPAIEKTSDLAAVLSTLERGDILFIDEAHRINRAVEELLYPAMETYQLHLVIGKGPSARMINLDLPPFTLIAATTRLNLLSAPLRSRFGAVFQIDYYSLEDIKKIIQRSAKILKVEILEEAVEVIAKASRFTPRIANRLLKRVRDLAQVKRVERISQEIALEALSLFEIDEWGLEEPDRRLLRVIKERFNGGPVGISSLAAALGEDKGIIEDVYEPYLIKLGFLQRTPSGRIITDLAKRHLENYHYKKD